MRRLTLLLLLLPVPGRSSELSWLFPGGGQFAQGQKTRGTAYAAGTLSLFGWGVYAQGRKGSGEVNAPLVYSQQVYVMSIYEAYRDSRPGTDPASLSDLVRSPFSFEQLKSPWVIGSAVAGAGINLALTRADKDRRGSGSMAGMRYLGDSFNREWGSAVYSAYWIPISIGAGVSEESLFRGVLQPELEQRWGSRAGLAATSGLFGLAHLDRLNSGDSWAQVGFASAAGLFLGWRAQENGNRLAESVAAHTWFDIAAGLALFFADPKENPLGAQVKYAF